MSDLYRRMSELWEWVLGDEEGVGFEGKVSCEGQGKGRREAEEV